MTTSGWIWSWKLWLVSWLAISGAISSGESSLAQITPDTTLGSENSTVTSTGAVDSINGGATRGANLFHSFQEFNIDEGRAAVFINPVGIENILTRVTGANPSNILGTLGVSGGNANLFLINPNGIIFGSNARLDVGGSFVGTTANAIGLGNQGFFSATNPEGSLSLLTVNPDALLFNQIRAAAIENNSVADSGLNPSSEFTATGLHVPDGNSLLLVGGDINMDGGGLFAFGGRVELGGLAGAGTVGLNGDGNNLSLSFPDSVERSNVSLSNGAVVDVAAGNGGSIAVNARNLEMTGRSILGTGIRGGLDFNNTKAGDIDINATGVINLNESSIVNEVQKEVSGQGGDVSISASILQVKDGAQVSAATFGSGKGGNLRVDATDVQIIGRSADGQIGSLLSASAEPNSTGNAGDLTINTDTLLVQDGARATVQSLGTGTAGNMTLNARSIRLNNNALLTANTRSTTVDPNSEQATININSQDLIMRRGSNIRTNATGENVIGGNININSDIIVALENSDISVNSANFQGGNVRINASAIFGTQFRDVVSNRTSDITTTGTSPEFSGNTDFNIGGLVNLPTVPVDTEVAQACTPGGSQAQSEFVVTGRGGLPPNPNEALSSDAIQIDWVTLNPEIGDKSSPDVSTNPTASEPAPIVEAQGWVIGDNGDIVLTATPVNATPSNPWLTAAN